MTGKQYRQLVLTYILKNFGNRGLLAYTEISIGKSIIGKNRKVDILLHDTTHDRVLAVECKFQGVPGTTDEKIPYALSDLEAMRIPGCIAYAGEGWSDGVRHLLESSESAAYCFPSRRLDRGPNTSELDHVLAQEFRWWDVLIAGRRPANPDI